MAQTQSDPDFPPTYDLSLQQSRTFVYTSGISTPGRPPSPEPSYHTIAPSTHNSISDTTAIHRAALETPEAILSKLVISNRSQDTSFQSKAGITRPNGETPLTSRFLSARTEPGDTSRYHVEFPTAQKIDVFKSSSSSSSVNDGSLIAYSTLSSTGIKIHFATGEIGQFNFAEVQDEQKIRFDLSVDGSRGEFYWEIVTSSEDHDGLLIPKADSESQPAAAAAELPPRPTKSKSKRNSKAVLGIESHRKKEMMQRMIGMRLIDAATGKIWAGYIHGVDQPGQPTKSTANTGRWGFVEVKCRAVMLDDGVDKAFVMLISLLETYMRLFGRYSPGPDRWGSTLAGVLLCSVM